jgi:hypothetical protein
MTKFKNHIYYAICLIVAIGAALPKDWGNPLQFLGLSPQAFADVKEFVALIIGIATWLKGHWNLISQAPIDNVPSRPSGEEQ